MPELQSKQKKSSTSSIGVEFSRISTEIDYTTTNNPKPTTDSCKTKVNTEKYVSVKI